MASQAQQRVLDALASYGQPAKPAIIAHLAGVENGQAIRQLLARMKQAGLVRQTKQGWSVTDRHENVTNSHENVTKRDENVTIRHTFADQAAEPRAEIYLRDTEVSGPRYGSALPSGSPSGDYGDGTDGGPEGASAPAQAPAREATETPDDQDLDDSLSPEALAEREQAYRSHLPAWHPDALDQPGWGMLARWGYWIRQQPDAVSRLEALTDMAVLFMGVERSMNTRRALARLANEEVDNDGPRGAASVAEGIYRCGMRAVEGSKMAYLTRVLRSTEQRDYTQWHQDTMRERVARRWAQIPT